MSLRQLKAFKVEAIIINTFLTFNKEPLCFNGSQIRPERYLSAFAKRCLPPVGNYLSALRGLVGLAGSKGITQRGEEEWCW